MKEKIQNKKAFTLVECVVAIAIIVLVTAALISVFRVSEVNEYDLSDEFNAKSVANSAVAAFQYAENKTDFETLLKFTNISSDPGSKTSVPTVIENKELISEEMGDQFTLPRGSYFVQRLEVDRETNKIRLYFDKAGNVYKDFTFSSTADFDADSRMKVTEEVYKFPRTEVEYAWGVYTAAFERTVKADLLNHTITPVSSKFTYYKYEIGWFTLKKVAVNTTLSDLPNKYKTFSSTDDLKKMVLTESHAANGLLGTYYPEVSYKPVRAYGSKYDCTDVNLDKIAFSDKTYTVVFYDVQGNALFTAVYSKQNEYNEAKSFFLGNAGNGNKLDKVDTPTRQIAYEKQMASASNLTVSDPTGQGQNFRIGVVGNYNLITLNAMEKDRLLAQLDLTNSETVFVTENYGASGKEISVGNYAAVTYKKVGEKTPSQTIVSLDTLEDCVMFEEDLYAASIKAERINPYSIYSKYRIVMNDVITDTTYYYSNGSWTTSRSAATEYTWESDATNVISKLSDVKKTSDGKYIYMPSKMQKTDEGKSYSPRYQIAYSNSNKTYYFNGSTFTTTVFYADDALLAEFKKNAAEKYSFSSSLTVKEKVLMIKPLEEEGLNGYLSDVYEFSIGKDTPVSVSVVSESGVSEGQIDALSAQYKSNGYTQKADEDLYVYSMKRHLQTVEKKSDGYVYFYDQLDVEIIRIGYNQAEFNTYIVNGTGFTKVTNDKYTCSAGYCAGIMYQWADATLGNTPSVCLVDGDDTDKVFYRHGISKDEYEKTVQTESVKTYYENDIYVTTVDGFTVICIVDFENNGCISIVVNGTVEESVLKNLFIKQYKTSSGCLYGTNQKILYETVTHTKG